MSPFLPDGRAEETTRTRITFIVSVWTVSGLYGRAECTSGLPCARLLAEFSESIAQASIAGLKLETIDLEHSFQLWLRVVCCAKPCDIILAFTAWPTISKRRWFVADL